MEPRTREHMFPVQGIRYENRKNRDEKTPAEAGVE